MDNLRLATPEEAAAIQEGADLSIATSVIAFDNAESGVPDLAVFRTAHEIDPIYFRGSPRRRQIFMWSLMNALRLQGIPQVYFNVSSDPETEDWRNALEKHIGAVRISHTPEFRYKKALL
jgi:hypothetical protein